MSQEEIDQALDNLELHNEADEVEEEIEELSEEKTEKPPGFLTYEEWIAKGKDPADFRGENAYKKQYDSIKEIRELKSTMTHVVESVEDWKKQQVEQTKAQIAQAKKDAVAELEAAKENEDVNAALAASEKIAHLDKQIPAEDVIKPHPVINEFISKNPIIDANSDQFDPDFLEDMQAIQHGILDKLTGGDRSREAQSRLTQRQIDNSLKIAFNEAKTLHPDKFTNKKLDRLIPPKGGKGKPKADPAVKLKELKAGGRNPRDTSAAMDVYNMIKAKDPEAAEIFAKNMTGE